MESNGMGAARPFICTVCCRSFTAARVLARHVLTHSEDAPYSCTLCTKRFYSSWHLERHERTHSGDRPYQCMQCDRRFAQMSQLKSHFSSHTVERPFACKLCDKAYGTRPSLVRHERMHSGGKGEAELSFACVGCDRRYRMAADLRSHEKTHSETFVVDDKLPFACSLCDKRYGRLVNLQRHEASHPGLKAPALGERPYACEYCEKTYKSVSNLKRHERAHEVWEAGEDEEERPFACGRCNGRFPTESRLKRHEHTHADLGTGAPSRKGGSELSGADLTPTGNEELIESFPVTKLGWLDCATCKTSYPSHTDLLTHRCLSARRLKFSDDPLSIFKSNQPIQKSLLSTHRAVNLKFVCSVCERRFSSRMFLAIHGCTHVRKRRFACCRCGVRFQRVKACRLHEMTHSRAHKFACANCGKKFERSYRLQLHRCVNSDERRFECGKCMKRFTNCSLVRLHSRIHHNGLGGEEGVTCAQCHRTFVRLTELREHRKIDCDRNGIDSARFKILNKFQLRQNSDFKRTENHDLQLTTFKRSENVTQQLVNIHEKLKQNETLSVVQSGLPESIYAKRGARPKRQMRCRKGERRSFPCPTCGKKFPNPSRLAEHARCHSVVRRCTQCNQTFESVTHLRMHARTHSGEFPFECVQCSKGFSSAQNLRNHQATHTSVRPYACAECGRGFQRCAELEKHKDRAHRGVVRRPFACAKCARQFTKRSNLYAHQRRFGHVGCCNVESTADDVREGEKGGMSVKSELGTGRVDEEKEESEGKGCEPSAFVGFSSGAGKTKGGTVISGGGGLLDSCLIKTEEDEAVNG